MGSDGMAHAGARPCRGRSDVMENTRGTAPATHARVHVRLGHFAVASDCILAAGQTPDFRKTAPGAATPKQRAIFPRRWAMADDDSLAGLQALHRDLCALIELKLPVLDRLVVNLETHLDELKALVDKKPKNDASRKALASGETWNPQ